MSINRMNHLWEDREKHTSAAAELYSLTVNANYERGWINTIKRYSCMLELYNMIHNLMDVIEVCAFYAEANRFGIPEFKNLLTEKAGGLIEFVNPDDAHSIQVKWGRPFHEKMEEFHDAILEHVRIGGNYARDYKDLYNLADDAVRGFKKHIGNSDLNDINYVIRSIVQRTGMRDRS